MDARTSRLFLVRHGQVDARWQGRIYGDRDVPLSEEGERQARAAAEVLEGEPLLAVVSSGLSRAEYGAACLRRTRPEIERVDDGGVREMARGDWAGKRPSELDDPQAFAKWHRDPVDQRPPGGESLGDLARRVLPRLDHWARVADGHALAIVSHCWPLRVATATALGLDLAQVTRLDIRTGEIVALDWPLERGPQRPVLGGFALDHAATDGNPWFRAPRS